MTEHILHQEAMGQSFEVVQYLLAVPFVLLLYLYFLAVVLSNRHKKKWPHYRTVFWVAGITLALVSVIGPVADKGHTDFRFHMIGHLLLGMLSPFFLALAAPMTLFLRSLPVQSARKVTKLLHSKFFGFYQHPAVATVLNIGGLWLLYTTSLYQLMHQNAWIYLIIHIHIFLAGYLFTISLIYIDPTSHRKSYLFRTCIFVLALAGHKILSKYIYAHPPIGVPTEAAEAGGKLMYYGGDAIEVCLITILFFQWYKATKPKTNYQESRTVLER